MRALRVRATHLVLFCTTFHLLGCGDEFTPASFIDRPRLLALRVEAQEEPSRAWPRPGEAATLRLHLGFPTDEEALSWALLACIDRGDPRGIGGCAGAPLALASESQPTLSAPRLDFLVPEASALGAGKSLLFLGILCPGAALTLESLDPALLQSGNFASLCPNPSATSTVFTYSSSIAVDAMSNQHPHFDAANISLRADLWPEEPPGLGESCDGSEGLPLISAASGSQRIGLSVSADSREVYRALRGAPPKEEDVLERLQFSAFTRFGKLDRQFAFLEENEPGESVEYEWKLSKDTTVSENRIVRFDFVVRDPRGGVDWIRRAFCLTP